MDLRVCLLLALTVSAFYMNPVTRFFNDDLGRTRLFHGMNAVVKVAPFIPITTSFDPQMSISPEDITNLVAWGFNFVRLGVMWEATEVSPGVYNTTYLNQVNSLITAMGEAGIYTLVDAHQDVYARAICGEGVPNFWAQNLSHTCEGLVGKAAELFGLCTPLTKYNFQYDSDGNPIIADCLKHMFSDYYMSPEAMSAFNNLYTNQSGLLDHFIGHWQNVAAILGKNPYVIGYDLINEPLAANLYTDPSLALPGRFDRKVLQPLYQKLANAIRQYSAEKIIFFEPVQTDLLPILGGIVFHAGFDETPSGPAYNSLQILNDHTYCCQASPSMCASGEPPLNKAAMCRKFHQKRVATRAEDAERLGTGLIISEFGACTDSWACAAEITSVAETCDEHLVSWAYWMFKGFGDYTTSGNLVEGLYNQTGGLQVNKLRALSRTYIQAFQGTPELMRFDNNTGDFIAAFVLDPMIAGPTELYFNAAEYYPNGYFVTAATLQGVAGTIMPSSPNHLRITFPTLQIPYDVVVTMTAVPPTNQTTLNLPNSKVSYLLKSRSLHHEIELKAHLPEGVKLLVEGEFGPACVLTSIQQKCKTSSHRLFKNLFRVMKAGVEVDRFSVPNLNGHKVDLEVDLL